MNAADIFVRKQLADCGYHYINVPIDVSNGHAIVAIDANKCITCVDTATHQVYNIPHDSMHLFQSTTNQNIAYSNPRINDKTTNWSNSVQRVLRPTAPQIPASTSMYSFGGAKIYASGDSGILECPSTGTVTRPMMPYPDTMDIDSHLYLSSNIHPEPSRRFRATKPATICGGIHMLTPKDFALDTANQHSPTFYTADLAFFDTLYMSLQEDATLRTTSRLDAYLYSHRDTRARMYLDAALSNQGCGCETSALEQYLRNNKTTLAAIALRATLSDEARRKVYQPVDARAMQNLLARLQGEVAESTRKFHQLGQNQRPDTLNPWSSQNEGVDAMGFGDVDDDL